MEQLRLILTCLIISIFGAVSSNNPPYVQFGPSSSSVFFLESTSIGTKLFTITGTDSDSLTFVPDNTATLALVSVTPVTRTGNISSVDVLLKAALDRDRSPNTRTLQFKVSDGASQIRGQVKLIVQDVNDNPPLFVNLPYRVTLDEGTSLINKTILTASTTDPDDGPGSSVVYSMVGADETYNKTFVIPNENKGDIMLALELDYETRSYYQYKIFAKDRGTPPCPSPTCYCNSVSEPGINCAGDPASFVVIVRDVQDTPPLFERLPYIAEVQENATAGTSFYQVFAQDGDRGVPNAVNYSIVNADNFPFTMDAPTGILRVGSKGLDSDQPNGRNYILTVMAQEVIQPGKQQGGKTTATTQVSITVDDINDNAPQFQQNVYYARVQENTPRGVPITVNGTIKVSDKDRNENSQFLLSVEKGGAPYEVFTTLPGPSEIIQDQTTVMVSVFNSSVLDYEVVKNITFQLKARENSTREPYLNTTTVILTIEDMNDNSPVFLPNQTRAVNVTENEKSGVVLAKFSATDADDGDFGTISYSLEDGLGKFTIQPKSGNLSVTGPVDREAPGGAGYSLVVVATDNMAGDEAQRRSRRLNIRVTVLDVNDNAPEFQTHPPSVSVQENASPGTALMTLTAIDKDEGINSEVKYKVVSIQSAATSQHQPQNLFDISEKTGVIVVNASLIGYPGPHNVTFMVFDSVAQPRNDSTMVTVYVQDVNMNQPVFVVPDEQLVNVTLKSLPNITVNEEQPIGTLILQLNATDKDTGSNGRVYYYLEPDVAGDFNYFTVDYKSGRLTNKQLLDLEKKPKFQITLKAEDQGSPTKLSKEVDFIVFLRDINDNPPKYPPPATLTLSVEEEVKNKAFGLVNVATDADSDPQNKIICYYLYGGQKVGDFFLVKNTGELRILKELDRDLTPQVSLLVKASADCTLREDYFLNSSGGPTNHVYNASDSSLLQLTVQVEDKNDMPPEFDKAALTVGLLYEVPIGYEVINLKTFTRDNDTAANSINYYRLLPGQPTEITSSFNVTTNGSVLTKRLFRADENGFFVLTVQAFDIINKKVGHTDQADVTIYLVSDVQRVKLVFNKRPNEVEKIKGEVISKLSKALNMTVIADKIASHITTDNKAEPNRTDVYIHARRIPTGEIVPANELWTAFDYNRNVRSIFQDYGVIETLPALAQKQEDDDRDMEKAFIIVAVILFIICIVLIVVLFNAIRRYRRRLRAATTSAFVASRQEEPNNYVPPGTNHYYAAENPLFGKDMKPMFIDRLENENDNDSLDNNAVDGNGAGSSDKDKEEEQEMYLEMYDDDNAGMHINHLAMVLQEYERDQHGEEEEEGKSSQAPPPYVEGGGAEKEEEEKGKSAPNGHVKSDSGFNEQEGGHDNRGLDDLQYSDI
ncbi:hypothetical protein ACOMHN_049491 [Nucella lapillus]